MQHLVKNYEKYFWDLGLDEEFLDLAVKAWYIDFIKIINFGFVKHPVKRIKKISYKVGENIFKQHTWQCNSIQNKEMSKTQ